MKHDLREYQTEVEEAVLEYLFTKTGNPVVAAPGGVGKSHIMNRLIKRMVTEWPGTRVMSLVHDAKVIGQNCNSMIRYWRDAPAGIFSAGLKQRDTRYPIIYAGIQSVAKKAELFGFINVVFVDECDLVSPKEETMYQKFIAALKEVNPELRVIGFTATPYRLGMGCLTNFELWDDICIDLTETSRFNWFIRHNFLAPLVSKKPRAEIDVTNISIRGGEFDEHDLQEAADTDELNTAVVEECISYGANRKHWLVFSSGVKHGHKLAKLFNARGVPAVMLSGEDTMDHREEMEELFRSGKVRCLVNCGLFGRGWDFPALDMIAWARATQSTSLWVQGCVRGTRTAPGKRDALVLDFAGNIRRLGPIDSPIIPAPRRKGDAVKGEAPVKECPECHSYLHTRTMVCPDCGYTFPPPQTVKKTASTAEIMKGSHDGPPDVPQVEDFYVLSIRYSAHRSKAGNLMMMVLYSVGTYNFKEYLMFGSDNLMAMRKTRLWWKHRGGQLPLPANLEEALDRAKEELNIPTVIRVLVNTKYPEVVGCDFDADAKISDDIKVSVDKPDNTEYDDTDIPF